MTTVKRFSFYIKEWCFAVIYRTRETSILSETRIKNIKDRMHIFISSRECEKQFIPIVEELFVLREFVFLIRRVWRSHRMLQINCQIQPVYIPVEYIKNCKCTIFTPSRDNEFRSPFLSYIMHYELFILKYSTSQEMCIESYHTKHTVSSTYLCILLTCLP